MNPYGGHNDRALMLAQETGFEMLFLRAHKETGLIDVMLRCNDLFAWACSDVEPLPPELWREFENSYDRMCQEFSTCDWFADAWAVKLRGVAPQKPATDRYHELVKKLDWLGVPWREMKRYDQMTSNAQRNT